MNTMISPFRKVMTVAVLAIALAAGSLTTLANGPYASGNPIGSNPKGSASGRSPKGSASTAEVKYVVNKAGDFIFNVVYNNAPGSRFSLRVLDAEGNQLFQSFYSDKKFDKKFRIADAE